MGLLGKDPGARGPVLLLTWLLMFLSESQSNDYNEEQNDHKTHKDRMDIQNDINAALLPRSYAYAQLMCKSKNVYK